MFVNFSEFDTIMRAVDGLIDIFGSVASILVLSPSDILSFIGLDVVLPAWLDGYTMLSFMVGVGLPLYIAYQFIIWLGNSVT